VAKVLVVDDDRFTVDLITSLLRSFRLEAVAAYNGEDALAILRDQGQEIVLIMLDLAMPFMNGVDVTRLIREELGLIEVPVIAVTARVDPDSINQAYASGVNEVLNKPFTRRALEEALRRLEIPTG